MNADTPDSETNNAAAPGLRRGLVAEFGASALSGDDLDALLTAAAAAAAQGMGIRRAKVLQYRPEIDDLLIRAGVNWNPGVVGSATLPATLDSPAGNALRTGEPVAIRDLRSQSRFHHSALLRAHGVVSVLNVPVPVEGGIWGVLEVDAEQPGRFTAEHTHFLSSLANVLGAAIQRLRAQQALTVANNTLERRVEERTRQLTESNRRLRHEIAERERAEAELRRQESEYRTLYNKTPAPQHSRDAAGRITGVSDYWLELFGYRREEVLGRGLEDFMAPESARWLQERQPALLARGEARGLGLQFLKRSGEVFDALLSGRVERDAQGRIVRTLGVLTDITARRRAERERDRLFEISQDLIVIAGFDGRIHDINPALEHALGFRLDEIRGRSYLDFAHAGDRARAAEAIERLRHGAAVQEVELRYRSRDGDWRLSSWRAIAVADDGLVYALGRDVTEQRQTEDALRQAQRMEAVGHLTGGVAHDFNNLLTVVLGNLELLRSRTADRPNLARLVDAIQQAVERGERLTAQLLAFSRRQKLQPEVLDVNVLVSDFVPLIRQAVGEMVEVETLLAPDVWLTHIDAAQLEAALLNLAVNARDAMPGGGRLTIETRNIEHDERLLMRVAGASPGPYVIVAVCDTGAGMPPDVVARAFEPFFTTKEVGRGTGLGLSQVYGFVEQSGGHVTIDSHPGHGTAIRLYLPAVPRESAQQGCPSEPGAGRAESGSERILLVEDNPHVMTTAMSMLAELGYQVQAVPGPGEALEVLRGKDPFDLLFTDIVMPQMSGLQLAREARALRPGLKVLLTSGYSREAAWPHSEIDGTMPVIAKPYRQSELAAQVRAVLAGAQGA